MQRSQSRRNNCFYGNMNVDVQLHFSLSMQTQITKNSNELEESATRK